MNTPDQHTRVAEIGTRRTSIVKRSPIFRQSRRSTRIDPMRADKDPSKRPIWPGTRGPSTTTPARAVPSWRRTASIDVLFPDDGPRRLLLAGRGRDLLTTRPPRTASTAFTVVDEAETEVEIDFLNRRVTRVCGTSLDQSGISALEGVAATGAFRRALGQALPAAAVKDLRLPVQLLDDTPVILVIAGSSIARRNLFGDEQPSGRKPLLDICAGWRTGGDMARAIDEGDTPFMGEGPLAPTLESADDELSWHHLRPLEFGSMRRQRRIDVAPTKSGWVIDALFRDSYFEPGGVQTVVHEYEILGTCDANLFITEIRAVARVLPGPECPVAAASATRLVGLSLGDIRTHVTGEFSGISTCTHLNDALRALGCVSAAITVLQGE